MDSFDPEEWPRFVHFPSFVREWGRLGLGDAALRALEAAILTDPAAPPVVRGTGALRKIRFTEPGSQRGKSGAYRVGYAFFPEFGTVALAVVFGKNEKDNLNAADRKAVAAVIQRYRAELEREFKGRSEKGR